MAEERSLRWSGPALRDLRSLRAYVSLHRPDAARRLAARIRGDVERLTTLPESGRVVPELGIEHIREVIVRPYRVIYEIRQHDVVILRVLHARQLIPESESD